MADHTPEPWRISPRQQYRFPTVVAADQGAVATTGGPGGHYARCEANARRIVACVNACAGIPREALENGVIPWAEHRAVAFARQAASIARLRGHLRRILAWVEPTGDPDVDAAYDERAAILAVQDIARAALAETEATS